MRSLLPQSLRDHFDFAEAFNELGRQRFAGEWTGEEVNLAGRGSVLCPQEAQELWREAEEKRLRLREKGYPSDDAWIRAVIAENEDTGDFDLERIHDDPYDDSSWPKLVERLFVISSYFHGKPGPDSSEYEKLHEAYVRGTDVLSTMLTLLADAKIHAFYKGEHGRTAVEPGLWGARTLNIDMASSAVRLPDAHHGLEGIEIPKAEAEAAFRKIVQAQSQQSRRNIKRDCREALTKMMREAPNAPRIKDIVRKEFPLVRWLAFNKLWSEAIKDTGAVAWRRPGRRPSQTDKKIVAEISA